MAIGRITGSVLKSNLTRNGVDLAFETNLLYLDVTNSRVGIGTSELSTALHVVGDTTITGALSISGALTAGSFSPDTISVNNLYSTDSTAIQVNDGLNVAGTLTANADIHAKSISFDRLANISVGQGQMAWNNADGTLDIGLSYSDVVLQVGQETHYVVRNALSDIIHNGTAVYCSGVTAGSGRIEISPFTADGTIDSVQFLGLATQDISNGVNGVVTYFGYVRGLDTRGTANTALSVGDEDWSVGDKLYAHPTAAGKLTKVEPTLPNQKICVASVIVRHQNVGKLFVRPTQHIPSDVAELTDNTNLLAGITMVGDDSSGTIFNAGETVKIAGASNITTAVSGDTLTITGPDLSSYLTAIPKTIDVNEISSSDSSAIQINDAVNVSGTLTAKTFVTNELNSEDSTAIQVNDAMNVSGTLTANTIQTNELSSTESTAIQVNDSMNASGTITAASFVTHGTSGNITGVNNIELNQISSNDSTAVQVADGMNVSGTLTAPTFVTNDISSGDSTAIQINDSVNISGTLSTDVIDVNEISSGDSSAIQINDSVNVSGTLNAKTIVTTNISSEDSTAVSINDGLNVSGTAKISGLIYPTADGTDGQVLKTDGAGNLSFATVSGGGGGGDSTAADTITYTGFGSNNVTVDTEITVGSIDTSNSISSANKVFDSFSKTDYDSAFYFVVTSNDASSEIGVRSVSIMHDGTTAYNSPGVGVNNGSGDHLLFSSGLVSETVTLYAIGNSSANTATFYRIGLGDSTEARSSTYISTVINTDVDTATETLDSWSTSLYRGAKYYISCTADNGQVSNIEALVVHDGSSAYISTFNEIFSGSSSIITLTADVNGSNVEVSASASANTSVICYRVILGDSEYTSGGTYSKIVGATAVSSSATALDTFDTTSYVGANYIVVSYNSTESAASVSEVFVASDGTTASVASSFVSSKNSAQLSFTTDCSAGIVTLSAASTSGSNTTVNAYRVHLGRPPAATSFKLIDSWSKTSYRAAKYFIAIKGTDIGEYDTVEATILHDSNDAYITTYNLVMSGSTYSAPGMITLSADVSGSLVRLKGVSTGEQNMRVTAVRHRVPI